MTAAQQKLLTAELLGALEEFKARFACVLVVLTDDGPLAVHNLGSQNRLARVLGATSVLVAASSSGSNRSTLPEPGTEN